MAENVIDSFLVALGFEVDEVGLDKFTEKVEELKESIVAVAAIAAGAAAGIGLFVGKIAGEMDDLGDFADLNQVSAAAVEQLGYAAQLNGSSLEQMKSSVAGLNRVMGEAVLGVGRGALIFQRLGFSAKNADGSVKSLEEMLGDISEKMQGMSRQAQIAMAEKLGLDASLVPMLAKGKEAIHEYREEAEAFGGLSDDDFKAAGDLQDSIDRTRFAFESFTKSIAVGLMPQMKVAIDGFLEWFKANNKLVRSGIDNFLQVLVSFIGGVWNATKGVIDAVNTLVEKFGGWNMVLRVTIGYLGLMTATKVGEWAIEMAKGIREAVGAFKGFSALLAGFEIWPILIGAVVVGIGLLIDDLMAFREGGDSVIGGLVEQFPELLPIINEVSDAFGAFFTYLGELWEQLKPSLAELGHAVLRLVQNLWPIFVKVMEVVGRLVLWLLPKAIALTVAIVDTIATIFDKIVKVVTWVVDGANKLISAAKAIGKHLGIGGDDKDAPAAEAAAGTASTPATATVAANGVHGAAASVNARSSTVNNSTTVNGGITVVSPDPEKAGESVNRELGKTVKEVTRNGQSGVAF